MEREFRYSGHPSTATKRREHAARRARGERQITVFVQEADLALFDRYKEHLGVGSRSEAMARLLGQLRRTWPLAPQSPESNNEDSEMPSG